MSVSNALLVFITVFLVVTVVDMIWIDWLAHGVYENQLGSLMREDVNRIAVFLVYLVMAIGITAFAVSPASSVTQAFTLGALLGFVVYGVYEFTNLSVIAEWPLPIVVLNIVWGTSLFGVVSMVGYLAST